MALVALSAAVLAGTGAGRATPGVMHAAPPAGGQAAPPTPPRGDAAAEDELEAIRRGDPFYLASCALCEKARWKTGASVTRLHGTRELRFCSAECERTFAADSSAALARLDAALIRDQVPHYPLQTSIVSGAPLGEKPVDLIWNNRLVRLAADEERAMFLARPDEWIARLDTEVIRAQSPVYGPTKCPVQGDFFDPEAIEEIVIGNRMIRLCCAKCAVIVRRNPVQYLIMVDSSNREAARRRER
jgi:hypothetical protein